MTKEMIEITFGNAIRQARELETCAEDMRKMVTSNLSSIETGMSFAWKGENADNYLMKLKQTADNILKTAQKLDDIADVLQKVAQIFRETETTAAEIATQRTYGS